MKTIRFALLAALALAASVTAQEPPTPVVPDLPPLPEFHALPSSCGLVLQVQPGDTCESIAAYANITVANFERLNPFALCGSLDPTPGAPVCAGDTISFCNDPYVATTQDTCHKINETVGTVINVAGLNDTTCGDLTGGTRVCVSPDPGQCAVDTLCGVSLSVPLQHALASLTDYCSIAAECETGGLSLTETEGKEGLVLTISESSPALLAAVDRPGHPELAALAYHQNAAAGTVLTVKITPDWFSDGSALVSSDFSFAKRRRSRRSLARYIPRYSPPTGRTRVPSYYWVYLYSG